MNEPVPQPPRRELELEALFSALLQQRQTFFAFLGTVLLVALLGTAVSKRKYESVAVIQLLPRAGQELELAEVVKYDEGGYLEGRDRARTQIQIILSRRVGEGVAREYNALGYDDIDTSPAGLDRLRRSMSASPREDTQLVEIGVLHADPERAALLANLAAKVYARVNLEARNDAAGQTLVWLDGQIQSYRAFLDEAQLKVLQFKQSNDLVNIDETVDGISTRISALQAALGEATTQRVLLESRLRQHQALLSRGQFDVLAGMFQDPVLQTLSASYANVSTEAAEISARYGEQHPDHLRASARVDRVAGLMAQQVRRGVAAERSQVQTLLQQETEINLELARIKEELLEKQRLAAQYAELKLAADRTQQLYDSLVGRRMEVDLQSRSNLNDVQIVDQALPPTRPATPNLGLNLMVALMVGTGGGLGLALLRHRVDDRIQTARDVSESLQAPLLGAIPRLPLAMGLAARALCTLSYPNAKHSEAIRGIRTMLLGIPFTGKCRRIVVTSAGIGEGKSHVAVNLAISLAQLGAHVLLVDVNLRQPLLHRILGVLPSPGFTDSFAIDGFFGGFQEDFGMEGGPPAWRTTLAWKTVMPRLHLLPAGSPVAYPNELLSSAELDRVIRSLGKHYQFIIFDTPPANMVSDAGVLARGADGVVLVAQQGELPRSVAMDTAARIRELGGRILGVVLNQGQEPPLEAPLPLARRLFRRFWAR